LLSNETLGAEDWAQLAGRMGWQALRMNLNTLARQGAFALPGVAEMVAKRLADPAAVAKARVYPYQLLAAYRMTGDDVPAVVREALQDALDAALVNVPRLEGRVVVCPDVSGSMRSPVTGVRQGATTKVRCVDVAALVAAAFLRTHHDARVLPFEVGVVDVKLNPRDSVLTNAEKLAAVGGGGTNCSAPLAKLVAERASVNTVIMVSDNESWVDNTRRGATETMKQWALIKRRNPAAKLVCIDLQPYGSTQAQEQADILNVGGFGDAVFDVIAQFAAGSFGAGHWVDAIESVKL
jgi:60 kDa SS-A/Ro ribonucleoprotein